MHRKAHEISMQVGNTSIAQAVSDCETTAFREEFSDTLKDQLNDYFPVLRTKFQIYRNGILDLIGNESTQNHPDESDESIYDKDVAKIIVNP